MPGARRRRSASERPALPVLEFHAPKVDPEMHLPTKPHIRKVHSLWIAYHGVWPVFAAATFEVVADMLRRMAAREVFPEARPGGRFAGS